MGQTILRRTCKEALSLASGAHVLRDPYHAWRMIHERGWQRFLAYPDEASATIVAEYLRRNDCPAQVAGSPSPDLSASVEVLVPGELLHRARWLWSQADLTEGELEYLITGKLPGTDEPRS